MPQEYLELLTSSSGRIKFAVIAAPLLCGADERLDALGEMYRQLAVESVAHAIVIGPLFDGAAVPTRGHAARYLADKFPQQSGVKTYALRYVAGGPKTNSLGAAMAAVGREDWVDFAHPLVWLRRPSAVAPIPLALVYDPADESFDLVGRRDFKRLHNGAHPSLVAAFGGRRYPDTVWRGANDAQMFSTVGVFNGPCGGPQDPPVGCMIFDLRLGRDCGTLVESEVDFWDWNATDLRRFDDAVTPATGPP